MSPVALGLDLLLIGLLLVALVVGLRLNKRLQAMRDGQAGFVAAVAELDSAATRAESALKALRSASEDTHDALLARIETARALCAKLDDATVEAERLRAVAATASPTPAPARAESRLDPRFRDDRFAQTSGSARRPALVRGLDEDLFEIEDAGRVRRTAGDRR
jgi:hypothetical protein